MDQESNTPRSYIVETENGNMLRKNRRDIMYTNETVEPSPDYDQLELCAPVPTTDNRGRANNERPRQELASPNEHYQTRYGRTVHKPIRFGYDE